MVEWDSLTALAEVNELIKAAVDMGTPTPERNAAVRDLVTLSEGEYGASVVVPLMLKKLEELVKANTVPFAFVHALVSISANEKFRAQIMSAVLDLIPRNSHTSEIAACSFLFSASVDGIDISCAIPKLVRQFSEVPGSGARAVLEDFLNRCKTIKQVEEVEKQLYDGHVGLLLGKMGEDSKIYIDREFFELKLIAARKKYELSREGKDVLFTGTLKPPKKSDYNSFSKPLAVR